MSERMPRKRTRTVLAGGLPIGGDAPISVQSMINSDPHDFPACLRAVSALEAAGCDIVRLTVPDKEAAPVFSYLREHGVRVPLVADIHFDHRLAIESIAAGADKIRLNPGNVGGLARVREVAAACRAGGIPIRIGVNGGSLERELLAKYGGPVAEALAESALSHARLLEACDFYDTVLSVKSSSVPTMIAANRLLSERCDHPLHLGVTEAGSEALGTLRSAIGLGTLLAEGIGDTVRVSLTADPIREVAAAREILSTLDLSSTPRLRVVSCPTCGRTAIDLFGLVSRFEAAVAEEGLSELPLTVALMGCAVNGPGEAREADIGIAGGRGEALLFEKGEVVAKICEEDVIPTLLAGIRRIAGERKTT